MCEVVRFGRRIEWRKEPYASLAKGSDRVTDLVVLDPISRIIMRSWRRIERREKPDTGLIRDDRISDLVIFDPVPCVVVRLRSGIKIRKRNRIDRKRIDTDIPELSNPVDRIERRLWCPRPPIVTLTQKPDSDCQEH